MGKYYEAYDNRYKRIHEDGLLWFQSIPTKELLEWISFNNIQKKERICEIGCGEGRDSIFLAEQDYQITGVDISSEALKTCEEISQKKNLAIEWIKADFVDKVEIASGSYQWVYSIGTLHMLVEDKDRIRFLKNIYKIMDTEGKLLLVNKGDGELEVRTSPENAFMLAERFHYMDNKKYLIEETSFCRKNWINHIKEVEEAGFKIEKMYNSLNDIYDDCMIIYATK